MCQHLLHEAERTYKYTPAIRLNWQVGVDLFFIISGFIIIYTSRSLFESSSGPRKFLQRRVVRVVPLYWLFTALLIPVTLALPNILHTARFEPRQILCSFLFYPGYLRSDGANAPLLATGWTLNYEMFFYAVMSPLICLRRSLAIAVISLIFLALTVIGSCVSLPSAALRFWSQPIILDFVAGAIVGHLYLEGLRLRRAVTFALAAAGVGLIGVEAWLGATWPRPLLCGLPALLIFAPFCLQSGATRKRLWPAPVLRLGDASYSLYLSHPFAIAAAALAWKSLRFNLLIGAWAYVVAAGIVCLAVGWGSYAYIERPLMRRLHRDRAGAGVDGSPAPVHARAPAPLP